MVSGLVMVNGGYQALSAGHGEPGRLGVVYVAMREVKGGVWRGFSVVPREARKFAEALLAAVEEAEQPIYRQCDLCGALPGDRCLKRPARKGGKAGFASRFHKGR